MPEHEVFIGIKTIGHSDYLMNEIASIIKTARSDYILSVQCAKIWAAKNANKLIKEANAPYIILLDDDLLFEQEGWDVALVDVLKKRQDVGLVAPRVISDKREWVNAQTSVPKDKIVEGVKICGMAYAFRNDKKCYYDENYEVTQYDDTDFVYQYIVTQNMKAVVHGGVEILHMKPPTVGSTPWIRKNQTYFNNKWKCNDGKMFTGMREI